MTGTPLADPDLLDPKMRQDAVAKPVAQELVAPEDLVRSNVIRGIGFAILLAVPFWIGVGLAIYFLL
jgi:hypothetical protein